MKSYKCPKCNAVSTAAAWDGRTQDNYGTGCFSIADPDAKGWACFDCPACSAEWIPGDDITGAADPYDTERDVTWQVVLYSDDAEDVPYEFPESTEEITPEAAAELARKHGYGFFEIMRTEMEVKRYAVEEVTEPCG